MTQTNERYHTAWKPQTVSTFLVQELRKKAFWLLIRKDVTLTINHL